MRYIEIKAKWENMVQKGEAGYAFDSEELAPGKFCVHLSDAGGASMASYYMTETTGFFDSPIDALAFFRFVQIPRVLDFDSGINREPYPCVAESYLLKYEEHDRAKIDHLLGLLDQALLAGTVTPHELSQIRGEFNAAFSDTNPSIQVLAWGNITECLASDYFTDVFIDDIRYEATEVEKPSTELKKLLDSGKFKEDNNSHLALARDFLERQMSA